MVSREVLASVVTDNDRRAERRGTTVVLQGLGFDPGGAAYVAEQRALRAVLAMRGPLPDTSRPFAVALSSEEHRLLTAMASVWLDGLAAGAAAPGR